MDDFNADNAKIDAALAEHDETLSAHTNQMSKFGNCQIYYTTYTGDGGRTGKTLYFPRKPLMLFVFSGGATFLISSRNANRAFMHNGGTVVGVSATWSGNSFTWDNSAYNYFSENGQSYFVIAFLNAAE